MTPHVAAIVERIRAAEQEFHQDLVDQAERWRFRLHRRSARFPADVRDKQRAFKASLWSFLMAARPLPLLTAPVIYSLFVPLAVLDVWMTFYQVVCFPVYGIPKVRRRDYFVIDHQRLAYLNTIEKVHCMYCGYANGLIAYVREIAARTEQYWCPIKHAVPIAAPHARYHLFVDYGDAEGYRRELPSLRQSFLGTRLDQPPAPGPMRRE